MFIDSTNIDRYRFIECYFLLNMKQFSNYYFRENVKGCSLVNNKSNEFIYLFLLIFNQRHIQRDYLMRSTVHSTVQS